MIGSINTRFLTVSKYVRKIEMTPPRASKTRKKPCTSTFKRKMYFLTLGKKDKLSKTVQERHFCNVCGKVFRKVRNMTSHKENHEIEKLRKFYYGEENKFQALLKTDVPVIDLIEDTKGDLHH